MSKSKKVFNCDVELTIDVIKSKWTPLIILQIDNSEIIRYGELKRIIPNIHERVLVRQLRELEKQDLIKRRVYDEVPPKVEYSLTEIGKTLVPILNALGEWGKKYNKYANYGKVELKYGCEQ